MEQKVPSALADLRPEMSKPSCVITHDTRAWLWFRSYILHDPELRLSLQTDSCAHTGAAGFLRWCTDHKLYPSAKFSRRVWQPQSRRAQQRKVDAFATTMLSFAAVICAPEADFEVKETDASGLGLFARRDLVLRKGEQVPGLMGWRRSLGDAVQPTASLNSWMADSMASKSADALIGPLSLGNHRCESDLEWARVRSAGSRGVGESKTSKISKSSKKAIAGAAVVVRAKAGKTVRVAAGTEIRWNYGQIDFECKCPDVHVHASRKRKRMVDEVDSDAATAAVVQRGGGVAAAATAAGRVGAGVSASCDDRGKEPAAKRPRTRSQSQSGVPGP